MAQTTYNCDDARRHHILYSVFYLNTRTSTKTTTHRKKTLYEPKKHSSETKAMCNRDNNSPTPKGIVNNNNK